MAALSYALAALLVAASLPAATVRDVRWTVGPARVELDGGRLRCALPDGTAIARGEQARAILEVVTDGAAGDALAVVSPTTPTQRWFVVVAWEPGRETTGPSSASGPADGGRVVNERLRVPMRGGAVALTLVAPAEEAAEARRQLERIAAGFDVGPRGVARAGP